MAKPLKNVPARDRVIAVDPLESRLEAAHKMGTDVRLIPSDETLTEINRLTESLDAIFIDCSGKTASCELAIPVLKIGETLLVTGECAKYPYYKSKNLLS